MNKHTQRNGIGLGALALALLAGAAWGQGGSLDTTFASGGRLLLNGQVRCIATQANGRIVIGGEFTRVRFGNVTNCGIARLNADGTLDATFAARTGFPNIVYDQLSSDNGPHCLAVQGDGKILAGGAFSMYRGLARRTLVRINEDGTPDASFNANLQANSVECILLLPDGKILIGGDISTVHGVVRTGVARLNTNGTLDATFTGSDVNGCVNTICRRADGKLLIGGSFKKVDYLNRPYVALLNADGTLVDDFYQDMPAPLGTLGVLTATLRHDNRILIGVEKALCDGRLTNQYVTALNAADGTQDDSFSVGDGPNGIVKSIALQADGRILVGGSFANFNSSGKHHFLRIWPDGFVDGSLAYTEGTGSGFTLGSREVNAILICGEQALIGGLFEKYENNTNFPYLARVNLGPVTPIPHAPVITEGERVSVSMSEDGDPTPFALTLHATDANNDTLTWYISTQARYGTASASGTGASKSIGYIPQAGFHGEDRFVVCVYDPFGGTDVITVRVTVQGLHAYFAGHLDAGFCDYERGINWCVGCVARAPNGQLVIGGDFTQVDLSWRWGIARLNQDGTVDESFDPDYGFPVAPDAWGNGPHCLAVQSDGKILAGGTFVNYNNEGLGRNRLIRILPNGLRDTNYHPAVEGWVEALAVQTNGQVLVAGGIEKAGGVTRWGIARLHADGALDPTFDPGDGPNGTIFAVTLQPDGRILVGGSFSTFAGQERSRIARLLPNGSVDPSWLGSTTITGGPPEIYSIALQSDGKVIIGGRFNTVNGLDQKNLARLNSDGSFDSSFVKKVNSLVHSVVVQANDKIIVGGEYAQVADRGTAWYTTNYIGLMRLNPDGSLDDTFLIGRGTQAIESPPYNWVKALLIAGDRAVVGGDFTHYQGVRRRRLVQIHLEDQAPLEINRIRPAGGGKSVFWTYYPETDHAAGDPVVHVQIATNLAGANWTTILQTNLGSVARAMEVVSGDTNSAPARRFYRLRRQ